MIEKRKNNENVPNLRFPGFEGEWKQMKIKDACEVNPKSSSLPDEFIYIDLESVSDGTLLKENEIIKSEAPSRAQRLLRKGDILFQMVRPYQMNNLLFDKEGDYVASTGYAQLRTKENPIFIFQYLHYQKFVNKVIKRCTGTSYPAINSSDLSNIKISIPSKGEQNKISKLLYLLDNRIQTQIEIIDNLNSLKRGLLQKIFNQEIRFKDGEGTEFPEWQDKCLGKIGKTLNGLTGKSKDDFGTGKPYIQYKQIFDNSKIDLSKCGKVQILETEKQTKIQYGDVFFTTSSETPNEIATSSVLLDEVDEIYLNSFCFGYRVSTKVLRPEFAQFIFRSDVFRKKITPLAQGSTRYNISKSAFVKLTIKLPVTNEQVKISNFLTSIDEKIEMEKQLFEQYESQKKYLLQNLFI